MKGVVTRRHVFLVARHFGLRAAARLLFTRKPVALAVLF